MKKYDENKCRAFYQIAKSRLQKGYSEEAAFVDKPEGFSEWLKDTYPKKLVWELSTIIRLPKELLSFYCIKTFGWM